MLTKRKNDRRISGKNMEYIDVRFAKPHCIDSAVFFDLMVQTFSQKMKFDSIQVISRQQWFGMDDSSVTVHEQPGFFLTE
jgi:hypothetical protein